VVAFIPLTERAGMRLYPVGAPRGDACVSVGGSLASVAISLFPSARGSGVP
jgi:hypothetical protein